MGGGVVRPYEVGAVIVRAELCANCEKECMEPGSEVAEMLDRGEEVATDIEGRERNKEVNVAAAFMSISESSIISCELEDDTRLIERTPVEDSLRLPLSSLSFRALDLSWAEVAAALALALEGFLGGDTGFGLAGAGTGGSWGLWIVRARLVGGGARMEANKL